MRLRLFIRLSGFAICLLLLMLQLPEKASADIIWTPDNNFLQEHYNDCEYIAREFTAKGPNGSVNIYKSPKDHKKVGTAENGTTFNVSHSYTDDAGVVWAVVQKDKISGWIRMKQLVVVYDYISFDEEHKSEFKKFKGSLHDYVTEPPLQVWTYPDSGEILQTFDSVSYNYLNDILYTYTDEDKRKWGCFYYSHKMKGWICLSDPANDHLTQNGKKATKTGFHPYLNSSQEGAKKFDLSEVFLMIGFLAVTINVTGIIIRVFIGKKKA